MIRPPMLTGKYADDTTPDAYNEADVNSQLCKMNNTKDTKKTLKCLVGNNKIKKNPNSCVHCFIIC